MYLHEIEDRLPKGNLNVGQLAFWVKEIKAVENTVTLLKQYLAVTEKTSGALSPRSRSPRESRKPPLPGKKVGPSNAETLDKILTKTMKKVKSHSNGLRNQLNS